MKEMERDITKKPHIKFKIWWHDGDNKLKKILYILNSWWNNGNNKLIKAIYVSLFLHVVFGFFWIGQYLFFKL